MVDIDELISRHRELLYRGQQLELLAEHTARQMGWAAYWNYFIGLTSLWPGMSSPMALHAMARHADKFSRWMQIFVDWTED